MGALRQPYLLSLVWSVRNEAPPTRPTKGTRRPSPAHARVESMARRAARRSACRFAWSDGRRADDATRPTRIELPRRAARLRPTHGLEHSQATTCASRRCTRSTRQRVSAHQAHAVHPLPAKADSSPEGATAERTGRDVTATVSNRVSDDNE